MLVSGFSSSSEVLVFLAASSTAAFHPPPAPTSSPDPKKDREMVLPAGLLYDRIDLRRGVGLLGHSFGALTSLLACTSTSAMDSQRGILF